MPLSSLCHSSTRLLGSLLIGAAVVATTRIACAADAPALQPKDVVLVVGDSITEQKMYSVLIEDYLLMCNPIDGLRVSQVGWSGEVAAGGNQRLEVSMLPFAPTVATLCYGMNDGGYGPIDEKRAKWYRDNQTSIVEKFKKAGVHTIVLGVGAVDSQTYHRNPEQAAVYNQTLSRLSDIDKEIAQQEGVTFADLHNTMVDAMAKAKAKYGKDYAVCGGDGVHPGWNGHLIMAYAYLKALGCDGNIGTITYDAAAGTADATAGHKIVSADKADIHVESTRYPFCFFGNPKDPNSTAGITEFFPFNDDLNRFVLIVKNAPAKKVKVTFGKESKVYDSEAAAKGINLAAEFIDNPFGDAFRRVQSVIQQQQPFETGATKQIFLALADLQRVLPDDKDAIEKLQQDVAAKVVKLRDASAAAVKPVSYTIHVEAAE